MKNNASIIGISVGAVLLGALGYYMYQNRSVQDRMAGTMRDAKGKFNDFKQKAKKEYQNAKENGEDLVDTSKERANQWINRAPADM
jgi:gas vesicle protein